MLRLAKQFDVSLEMILRRLRNEAFESSDVCFPLCRSGKIGYTMYPPWLRILRKPVNTSIQHWFRTSGLEVEKLSDGSLIANTEGSSLTARRVGAGSSLEIFEIRSHPDGTPFAELRSKLLRMQNRRS
jgi:hypothetical protein